MQLVSVLVKHILRIEYGALEEHAKLGECITLIPVGMRGEPAHQSTLMGGAHTLAM